MQPCQLKPASCSHQPLLLACLAAVTAALRDEVACQQVGQPMVRVLRGKLQLGVVVDIEGGRMLVAVVVPSRVMPDTSIDKNQVKCVHCPSIPLGLSTKGRV
jgi:hypothetical protein